MASIKMDYLKSIPGILKIIEFVILLLAFSCMADCCGSGSGRYAFFLAVTIIAWIFVIVIFLFFFLDQTGSIPQLNWNLVVLISSIVFAMPLVISIFIRYYYRHQVLISSIVFAILLLICSALMADVSADTKVLRNNRHTANYWTQWWDTMTAGVVFGFLAMLVFIIDAVMHAKGVTLQSGGGEANTAQPA